MTYKDITPEMCLMAMEGLPDNEDDRYLRSYLINTHVVPEWFLPHFNNALEGQYKFYITHGGEHYERYAASAADAKNGVRYALYGRTPEAELPPFEVEQAFPGIANAVKSIRQAQKNAIACKPRPNSLSSKDFQTALSRLTGLL